MSSTPYRSSDRESWPLPRAEAEPRARNCATANLKLEPGSFRDRNGRVFYGNGAVFRGLGERAAREWEALRQTGFFERFMREGKIVRTERVDPAEALGSSTPPGWSAVLKHEEVPFVSYPYEWCFGMLKDAALLTLDLLLAALEEGMILKDSSAFNVQWRGTQPVFIDIPSFERLQPGEPWVGYRQFCQLFLNPLFLQAYKDVPFQPWLRGSIDGIEPEQCKNVMSARDLLRPGVLAHVLLHASAQARAAKGQPDIKKSLRAAGFNAELIKANAARLRKIVEGLRWGSTRSAWADYSCRNSYSEGDHDAKLAFVREAVAARPRRLVWDLGSNTGTFARVAAEHADYVVAMDADHLAVERLYRDLKAAGNRSILPLVVNLADSSPDLGWRGLERKALTRRSAPDLTLCLALVHHVVISANIPLDEFVGWLASLGADVVIEFVSKADPMVRILLQNKEDIYEDYDPELFERCLSGRFDIVRREALGSGTRTLYHGRLTAA